MNILKLIQRGQARINTSLSERNWAEASQACDTLAQFLDLIKRCGFSRPDGSPCREPAEFRITLWDGKIMEWHACADHMVQHVQNGLHTAYSIHVVEIPDSLVDELMRSLPPEQSVQVDGVKVNFPSVGQIISDGLRANVFPAGTSSIFIGDGDEGENEGE